MAMTLIQLQAWRDLLVEASSTWAGGVKRVSFEGRSVDYASVDEMLKLIAWIDGQIGLASPANTPIRQIRIYSSKGW